ncbi:MAG: tRNA (adenosine(37)-N6)-threonylcarbamoyltransferase complex dimerization subunit type 1 TsaB [Erysipelotrichaceae bacterium]
MISLAIDTSFNYLVLALIKDDEILDSLFLLCPKQQSEITVQEIAKLLAKNDVKAGDLENIIISKGPGSYTGVRIAMSIAKVYTSQLAIKLYTLSTLQLYAGLNDMLVLIDARGERVYLGIYQNGKAIVSDRVLSLESAADLQKQYQAFKIYGHGELINLSNNFNDISGNFLLLKDQWELVENIHTLTPEYLKDISAYGH